MQFRILGPLEVHVDGVALEVRGRHHPKLLALLLAEAGRAVSADRIVEALWEADPPDTARRQVQNIVGALRKQLGPAGAMIEAIGTGYRCNVLIQQLDLLQCKDFTATARRCRESGRHTEAAEAYRQALSQWRGPALVGFSGRVLEAVAQQLDESRLQLVCDRAELELELGGHERLIAELREAAQDNPYHQRLIALWMLALHRSGRTPEALEVYARSRQTLIDKLGIEPGRALRDLHTAILRDDAALLPATQSAPEVAAPARTVAAVAVPAQLPADIAGFTGRETELSRLDGLSAEPVPLVAVTGPGGVGKTALVLHWAHRNRDRFPDGQLYLNLRGFDESEPVRPRDALSRMLVALGFPGESVPAELEDAAAMFRSALADRRILIVLDNVRTADQVRPLLSGGGGLTLVTSRDRISGLVAINGACTVGVDVLSRQDSLDLLGEVLGDARMHQDPAAAVRLVELCGYLPLALRIAGANLAAQPYESVTAYAARLAGSARLDELAVPGDSHANVASMIASSVGGLDAASRLLFFKLGLIPGEDFALGLVAALAGQPENAVEKALRVLESRHLLEQYRSGRYRLHDLVRLYARQCAAAEIAGVQQREVGERIRSWYGDRSRHDHFTEFDGLMAAAMAYSREPGLWRMLEVTDVYLQSGYDRDRIREVLAAALAGAESQKDSIAQAVLLNLLAASHVFEGALETGIGHAKRAAAVVEGSGDEQYIGDIHGDLALYLSHAGEISDAIDAMVRAVAAHRRVGPPWMLHMRLVGLGNLYRRAGRLAEAEQLLIEAHGMEAEPSDSERMEGATDLLALLYLDLGRLDAATELIAQMFANIRITDPILHARAWIFRAELRHRRGELAAAFDDASKALEIARESKYLINLRAAQFRLARIAADQGDPEAALRYADLEDAAGAQQSLPHRCDRAAVLCLALPQLGRYEEAIRHGEFAQSGYREAGNLLARARTLSVLGDAHHAAGDESSGRKRHAEALEIFDRLGVPEAVELRTRLAAEATSPDRV